MSARTTDTHATHIPYGRQVLGAEEREAVAAVVASGWISRGPKGREFEARVAEFCGARHAVAVSSGTAGLHLAALAAGLKPGKRCWTTPISFVATANCALHAGAEVAFIDIDPVSVNLDVDLLEEELTRADQAGALPDVVIPVHFAGHACPMERVARLAQRFGFLLIEDACHALGSSYQGHRIGGCHDSAMAVLSFHPVKSITTAEGGMVLTNDASMYEALVRLRNNGITKEPEHLHENHGPWYYEAQDLGLNYWLTEIQAALGLCQMNRLDGFVARRNELAERYVELLRGLPVRIVRPSDDCHSAYHLMVIQLELSQIKPTRRNVFEALQAAGLGVQVHYIPIPAHPYYRKLGFRAEDYPRAWSYYESAITLPLFPTLRDEDLLRIVATLKESMGV